MHKRGDEKSGDTVEDSPLFGVIRRGRIRNVNIRGTAQEFGDKVQEESLGWFGSV